MEVRKTLALQASDFMAFISRVYRKLYAIVPAAVILLFAAVNLGSNEFSLRSMVIPAALTAVFPLGLFFYMKNASKKALASFVSANGDVCIVINETGVSTAGSLGTTALSWANVFQVIETKTVFFFYIHKTNAIVLPKRQLSADEREFVLTLIRKKVDPKKVRLLSK